MRREYIKCFNEALTALAQARADTFNAREHRLNAVFYLRMIDSTARRLGERAPTIADYRNRNGRGG